MTALGLLVRWVHLTGGVVLVGALAVGLLATRPGRPTALRWEHRTMFLARLAAAVTLVAGLGWLAVQVALLEGGVGAVLDPVAVGRVLGTTRFGTVWIVREALLILVAAVIFLPSRDQSDADGVAVRLHGVGLGAVALGAGVWAGHAGAAEPAGLAAAADALHVAAVGVWIGGLLPLAWLLRAASRPEGADARPFAVLTARRFSNLALGIASAVVVTGVANAWTQVGDFPALVGTPYGRLLLAKLGLVAAILALGGWNRRRVLPALAGDAVTVGRPAMRRLGGSVGIELAIALAVLGAVAWMTVTPPARHVAPTWPLPFRLSADATAGLPGVRLRVLIGIQLALLGVLAALVSALVRRPRAAFAIGVGATAAAAVVALPPLVVDAYPTTYHRPPLPYHAASIAAGAALYAEACVGCHARDGRDMTSARVARRTAGDLFWWISHGIPGTRMAGAAGRLSEDERWDLVNFVRARSAAEQARRLGPAIGAAPPEIAAPDFSFAVGPSVVQSLREYRGRRIVVLVFFTLPDSRPRLVQLAGGYEALVVMGAEVIAVPMHPAPGVIKRLGATPRIFFPVVTEGGPPIVETYGLLRGGRGLPPHMEFIIDRQGYLRARLLPSLDAPPPLSELLDQLQQLNEEPQTAPPPPDHVH